jgi:hypothetical protein
METDKVLLKGSGLIDLKTEELDLGANLAAREGIRIGAGTLGSLVRVRGTLAKPELATDLAGVAKTGARVGLAFATGGLSLLAETAYGYVSEDDQPCQTALARTIDAIDARGDRGDVEENGRRCGGKLRRRLNPGHTASHPKGRG